MIVARPYNGSFEWVLQGKAFPDGWVPRGGDARTTWLWTPRKAYDGEHCIAISNPTYATGGSTVIQEDRFAIDVSPGERWILSVYMATNLQGKRLVAACHFLDQVGNPVSSTELRFSSTIMLEEYVGLVAVPPASAKALVEVGVQDTGMVWIDLVRFRRLHPPDLIGPTGEDCWGRLPRAYTQDGVTTTLPVDISNLRRVTFFFSNLGVRNPAVAFLEVSPDKIHWQRDTEDKFIAPGETRSLVPLVLSKYARVCFRCESPGKSTKVEVRYEGQQI